MPLYRLDSYLSKAGLCSRRHAKKLIERGKVDVNGTVCTLPARTIDSKNDRVECNKTTCVISDYVYFAFNKPEKVESTNKIQRENRHRKTARSFLLSEYSKHLFSIGRLDYRSSGLMLFTNDGELCYQLSHPKFKVEKTYEVSSDQQIPEQILKKWQKGLKIGTVQFNLKKYRYETPKKVELVLTEGKNREIRRVFEHYSISIKRLHRSHFATITLRALRAGEFRILTNTEILTLKNLFV